MERIIVKARNNLNIPIRLTMTSVGYKDDDAEILITIGEAGTALKDYYRVCIDTDLPPNQDWDDTGSLCIVTKCKVIVEGNGEVNSG